MLPELHASLRRLLYERGGVSPDEVEISFEAPTQERIDRVGRPTLNFFLYELRENVERRQTNVSTTRGNGHAERRLPPRRIDLHYLVSALTTNIDDEHRLLWRAFLTLLKFNETPRDLLPEELRVLDIPVMTRVSQPEDGQHSPDLWGALGAKPRLALHYIVTAPVDLEIATELPLVLTRTLRFRRSLAPGGATEEVAQIGGVVRDKRGEPLAGIRIIVAGTALESPLTGDDGRYTLSGIAAGPITLLVGRPGETDQRLSINIPAATYDLTLE